MTPDEWTALLAAEEAKRQRCVSPAERWRVIQETITWAESQLPVLRNSKEGCLAAQRRRLEGLEGK